MICWVPSARRCCTAVHRSGNPVVARHCPADIRRRIVAVDMLHHVQFTASRPVTLTMLLPSSQNAGHMPWLSGNIMRASTRP